jgi:hypothetical protein
MGAVLSLGTVNHQSCFVVLFEHEDRDEETIIWSGWSLNTFEREERKVVEVFIVSNGICIMVFMA